MTIDKPVTLHWVWHSNVWRLAIITKDAKVRLIEMTDRETKYKSDVVVGPEAGVLQPWPKNTPVWQHDKEKGRKGHDA